MVRTSDNARLRTFAGVLIAVFVLSALSCGIGGESPLEEAFKANKMSYRSTSINRFPDYDAYVAAEATKDQWIDVSNRLKLNEEWQRSKGNPDSWKFGPWLGDPPAPSWWKPQGQGEYFWKSTDGFHQNIMFEGGCIYYIESTS